MTISGRAAAGAATTRAPRLSRSGRGSVSVARLRHGRARRRNHRPVAHATTDERPGVDASLPQRENDLRISFRRTPRRDSSARAAEPIRSACRSIAGSVLPPTRTTTRLIEQLRDPANAVAWTSFDQRYRPVLIRFARSLGFGPEAAAEVAQQALVEFVFAYRAGRYSRERGRLSSWLLGIVRNVAARAWRSRRAAAGDVALTEVAAPLPEEARLTQIWEREREAALLIEALARLRQSTRAKEHTLRAFELAALRGVPAAEVAAQCGIDVDTVYVIKNRFTKRLREIVRELTDAFERGD